MFKPAAKELFFVSQKKEDPRLGELVSPQALSNSEAPTFLLPGYPDDEGIAINGGRLGAGHAPDVIRKYFYKMTPSAWVGSDPQIVDLGNWGASLPLAERHEKLKHEVANFLKNPHTTWLGLGGGHDYG